MYLLTFALLVQSNSILASAITYGFSKGRFADQVASYCHARWISYIHSIEFLYRPFIYSDQLEMHYAHAWYHPQKGCYTYTKTFPKKGGFLDIAPFMREKHKNILYFCPFFPEVRIDAINRGFAYFDIDWKDEGFKEILRKEIRPLKPLAAPIIPAGHVSVAVHVRKGSGPDKNFFQQGAESALCVDKKYPLRFPPDVYYLEQIEKLADRYAPKPLYVHLFTDARDSGALAEKFKKALSHKKVVIGCRTVQDPEKNYDLEDFFGMTHFECIIRPESHFSLIPSKIGNAHLVIHPVDYQWNERELVITKVEMLVQD